MRITLGMGIRKMGIHPTENQTLNICKCRTKLQSQIDEFIWAHSIPTVGVWILGHKCLEQLWNRSWTQYCYSRSTFLHPQTTYFKKYPQPHPSLHQEGDPKALRLSDEIAQHVAKDLKLYGGDATSFSLQLLSFAAVVRENSRGGAFESVPDWTSITNDNPRIKSHLRFDKTVDYLTPSSFNDLVIATTATANPPTVLAMATAIVPPSAQLGSPSKPSLTASDILPGPEQELKGSSDLRKEKAEDPPVPIHTPADPLAKYNLFVARTKKRKAAEDMDAAVAVAKTELPSASEEPVKKRKITSKPISKKEWGSDDDIATPWKCDKCAKLDIACIVLPNKKFGHMRLACANCDSMKITCAIDSIGVRQRLQAKFNMKEEKKLMDILPGQAHMQPEDAQSLAPTNLPEPEPTAREILQGIQDLGRRLDLLAANERVDALEVRVGSMETNLLKRLDALEQRLNASDARWKSLESLG
ncbi:uncharacterized protein F5147DRAFT_655618 [Suillus discolor]|uniref:Uncharacterized protein n=1 Tax=Suillus discolor TaxID=1912936 RepID=A0A9P7JQV3_9AGAM|nr:uncharacterized protein F5147DRAFT_655618 [Suillus discolor]KAG2100175.1 hypothetical protein F5147DRAFT_655618 [Suillus discolor]